MNSRLLHSVATRVSTGISENSSSLCYYLFLPFPCRNKWQLLPSLLCGPKTLGPWYISTISKLFCHYQLYISHLQTHVLLWAFTLALLCTWNFFQIPMWFTPSVLEVFVQKITLWEKPSLMTTQKTANRRPLPLFSLPYPVQFTS